MKVLQMFLHPRTCLLLLLFLSVGSVYAQSYGWMNYYGEDSQEKGYHMEQTPDGGFVLVGFFAPDQTFKKDIYVVKIDNLGNQRWDLKVGEPLVDERAYGVAVAEDSTIMVISGVAQEGDSSGWTLTKVSAEGELLWHKRFLRGEYDVLGSHSKVISEGNGSYTLITRDVKEGDEFILHPRLMRVEQDSMVTWTKNLTVEHWQANPFAISPTLDGGYALTHYVWDGGDAPNVYLIKADGNGDQMWYKTYGDEGWESGQAISQLPTGEYVLSGRGLLEGEERNGVFIMKLSETGAIIWQKDFQSVRIGSGGAVSAVTNDGNIVLAVEDTHHTIDLYKYTPDGEELWKHSYEFEYEFYPQRLISTPDGGFAAGGFALSPEVDMCLIKLNKDGLLTYTHTLQTSHSIKVYPNPSSDQITFEIEEQYPLYLKLFNDKGSLLKECWLRQPNQSVSLEGLPKGMLIYQIFQEGKVLKSGSIIKI